MASQNDASSWEYCQVYRDRKQAKVGCISALLLDFKQTVWYFADAMSPIKGKYQFAKSREFEVMGNEYEWAYHFDKSEEAKRVLDGFASKLIKNGWEPLSERGENWWHLRFRRKVK